MKTLNCTSTEKRDPNALPREPEARTAKRHEGARLYNFEALYIADKRRRMGRRISTRDREELALAGEVMLTDVRNGRCARALEEDSARVETEIRQFGLQTVIAFYRSTGRLETLKKMGVRFRPEIVSVGDNSRASKPSTPRSRGPRGRSGDRSSGGGDSDSDGSGGAGPHSPTCAAPWCSNTLPPYKGGRPRKYCDDADCARQRNSRTDKPTSRDRANACVSRAATASKIAEARDLEANLADIEVYAAAIRLGRHAGCFEPVAIEEFEGHLDHLYEIRRQIKVAGEDDGESYVRTAVLAGSPDKPRVSKPWKRTGGRVSRKVTVRRIGVAA